MITEKIDSITKVGEDRRFEILPAPKSVKIEITPRCNLACGFCAHSMRKDKSGNMNKDFFFRIVPEMVEAGVEELGLFYIGESMLCDWLAEAIAYAKACGIKYTFLTSNGVRSFPHTVKPLMEAGLDSLKWSVNEATPEQFAEITGTSPKGFHALVKNIKSAWHIREAYGYKTKLYASSIKYDGVQGVLMEKLLEQVVPYVDQHYWLPLYSFGGETIDREKEMGFKPTAGNQGRLDMMREPLPCWSVFTEGHITFDGKLSACCFDVSDGWIMGNLNEDTFMDAWNSDKFQQLRRAHLNKNVKGTACESCAILK